MVCQVAEEEVWQKNRLLISQARSSGCMAILNKLLLIVGVVKS